MSRTPPHYRPSPAGAMRTVYLRVLRGFTTSFRKQLLIFVGWKFVTKLGLLLKHPRYWAGRTLCLLRRSLSPVRSGQSSKPTLR